MFRFHLKLRRNNPKTNPQSREEYLSRWNEEIRKGRSLAFVASTEGYRDAMDHFETVVNAMLRDDKPNQDFIKGVEAVFSYFERGEDMAKTAEANLEKFKDVS